MKGKLLLIDDVDGLTREDRGGAAALAKLIAEPTYPVILTCQDPFDKSLSALRSKCQLIEFKSISKDVIASHLSIILKKENIAHTPQDVVIISEFSQGDLRAAINDAQMLSIGSKKLDVAVLLALDERLKNKSVEQAVREVLKGKGQDTLHAFDATDADLEEAILWLDYNMPKEYYNPADRARAYGCLSKADVFLRRIKRRQHWHFLVYVNVLLTAGIASAKEAPYEGEGIYEQTTRLLKIWRSNISFALRNSIAEKIAAHTHTSKREAILHFDFYKGIYLQNKEAMAKELKLDDEEITFLSAKV